MRSAIVATCLALVACGLPATADEPARQDGLDVTEIMAAMQGAPPEASAEPKKAFPDFKKITEDMKSVEGMFTLWAYPPDAKDKDKESTKDK